MLQFFQMIVEKMLKKTAVTRKIPAIHYNSTDHSLAPLFCCCRDQSHTKLDLFTLITPVSEIFLSIIIINNDKHQLMMNLRWVTNTFIMDKNSILIQREQNRVNNKHTLYNNNDAMVVVFGCVWYLPCNSLAFSWSVISSPIISLQYTNDNEDGKSRKTNKKLDTTSVGILTISVCILLQCSFIYSAVIFLLKPILPPRKVGEKKAGCTNLVIS